MSKQRTVYVAVDQNEAKGIGLCTPLKYCTKNSILINKWLSPFFVEAISTGFYFY